MKKVISRLHIITQDRDDKTHIDQVMASCKGGADWIQLRVKNTQNSIWEEIAKDARKICVQYNAKLIINDSPKLAKTVGADGVHLGRTDMDPLEARKILGADKIIGGTANTIDDIRNLVKKEVDYIGLGPYRFTTTKQRLSPVIGLLGLQEIMDLLKAERISVPIVLIGGLRLEDVSPLMHMGIDGLAISSVIHNSVNPDVTVKAFLNALRK